MDEQKAIQLATMHLEGIAYDWWHHGLVSQRHAMITSYDEFTQKLITRFDRKDVEVYSRDLAQLRQIGKVDSYINEFQRIAVMVPDMIEKRTIMLFVEGLNDKLKGLVKAHKPSTLDDAIELALDLDTTPSFHPQKKTFKGSSSNQRGFNQPKYQPPRMDQETKNEMRRKKLCFSCKEPWEPGHRCLGKGKVHLIEVISNDESEFAEDNKSNGADDHVEQKPQLELEPNIENNKGHVTIASISGVSRYNAF